MPKLKLTKFPERRYTQMESHLFDMLPQNGRKVGSADIADARLQLGNWDITHQLNTITVTMNRLIDKVEANDEPFRIVKDGKRPRHPLVEYWIEHKKQTRKKVVA